MYCSVVTDFQIQNIKKFSEKLSKKKSCKGVQHEKQIVNDRYSFNQIMMKATHKIYRHTHTQLRDIMPYNCILQSSEFKTIYHLKKDLCISTLMSVCVCVYSNFRAAISRVLYFHHNYHKFFSLVHRHFYLQFVCVVGWLRCMHHVLILLLLLPWKCMFADWYGLMLTIQILL